MAAAVDRLLSGEEVAELFGAPKRMVNDLRRAGSLRGVRLGRLWRYRESDVRAFLDAGGGPARGGKA
ncbi:MAG: helix-turn-helix domain-containing protein [Acidimicrobiales bacterium]|nr:helix-turn-helix domain-containing protein [Acidimicrobiales bacterium]